VRKNQQALINNLPKKERSVTVSAFNPEWFPKEVLPKPSAFYAHIILLRVTDSYALFQTDGELNTARVRAGEQTADMVTRIEVFKRKQTTPERLNGRELLRHYRFLSVEPSTDRKITKDAQSLPICDYNVAFCMTCPDCITYGFAIGDAGSEKSKVIADTTYSLTPYDDSHETRTLNAPFEDGTMSRQGEVTSRINEQDHVKPGVIFPSVITVRDVTAKLFRYVLNNVIRTRHYGAQTTRTGTMINYIVGVVQTDREIFSNLKFTQRLYDVLKAKNTFNPPDPVDVEAALSSARELIPVLLHEDGVSREQMVEGKELDTLLLEARCETGDQTRQMLQNAFGDSQAYHDRWIAKSREKSTKR
jgi:CRISPR-associated protein Csc2